MPKNQFSIEEFKVFVEKLKHEMWNDGYDDIRIKDYANKYLNKVLDRINEYRY